VKDNQTKQISLVQADTIPVKKELLYHGANYYYYSRYGEAISNQKVGVFVEIRTKRRTALAFLCRKGTVRRLQARQRGKPPVS